MAPAGAVRVAPLAARATVDRLDDAIVEASVSRLRPVFLAAVTTILGMTPLLSDAFFASMAVTIMAGLAFASAPTMIAAPVLYYLYFPGARKGGPARARKRARESVAASSPA